MNNSIELTELRKTFEEITSEKTCQGTKARLAELDESAELVCHIYDTIPEYHRLRAYMRTVLSKKPNWGNRELMKKFDLAIGRIYG